MNRNLMAKWLIPSFICLLACPTLSATSLPVVGAQTAFANTETDLKKAKRHFALGSEAFEKSEFATAAKEFLKSYEFSNNPLLLFNVAKSYQEADDLISAKKYYIEYLNAVPDADNGGDVQAELANINRELEKRIYKLKVISDDGITYALFGDDTEKELCKTPCDMQFNIGEHVVTAIDPDGNQKRFPITITPDKNQTLNVSRSDGTTGTIHLQVDNSKLIKNITVGEKTTYGDRVVLHNTPVGKHPIRVETDKLVWLGTVVVAPGKTTDIRLMLQQLERLEASNKLWRKAVAYSSLGLGAAAIGSAVFLGLRTEKLAEIQRNPNLPSDAARELRTYGEKQKLATNLLYGAGGAVFGLGLGFLIWDLIEKPSVDSDVVFVPIVVN